MILLNPGLDEQQFRGIEPITWLKVRNIWEGNEAHLEHWQKFYTELGFPNWSSFRRRYFDQIRYMDYPWYLYEILDPLKTIPQFRGGQFKGWYDKFYNGKRFPKFSQMLRNPDAEQYLANFPKETTLCGFWTRWGMFIFEGMHRCSAIASAARDGSPLESKVFIAVGISDYKKMPKFDYL